MDQMAWGIKRKILRVNNTSKVTEVTKLGSYQDIHITVANKTNNGTWVASKIVVFFPPKCTFWLF